LLDRVAAVAAGKKEAAIDWEAIIPLATTSGTPLPPPERYGLRVMSLGLLASEPPLP
jgi:hypothetical protein